jgi:excisionase family DNA binding protein
METLDRLLTVDDLAEYLDVPKATLYAWRYHGQGPRSSRIGKHLRYRHSDVTHWIGQQLEPANVLKR